jgi:hypothetical protein
MKSTGRIWPPASRHVNKPAAAEDNQQIATLLDDPALVDIGFLGVGDAVR